MVDVGARDGTANESQTHQCAGQSANWWDDLRCGWRATTLKWAVLLSPKWVRQIAALQRYCRNQAAPMAYSGADAHLKGFEARLLQECVEVQCFAARL